MLDKVRARVSAARDAHGRFIPKSNDKTAAADPRRTFVLGRERIKLSRTSAAERAALEAVKAETRVHMRNKLGLARGLAQKYPLFEGAKTGRTPAAKRRDAHQARKAAVAARSVWARRIG